MNAIIIIVKHLVFSHFSVGRKSTRKNAMNDDDRSSLASSRKETTSDDFLAALKNTQGNRAARMRVWWTKKQTTDAHYYYEERERRERYVIFVPPAPSTSILIVPLGPRLVFMTSCKPFAALMFMNNAAALSMDSAFGFTERREDAIFFDPPKECVERKKKQPRGEDF